MKFRKCKIFRKGKWVEIKFKALKKDDKFRLCEDNIIGEYTAADDAYYNSSIESWAITVRANLTFPSPEKEDNV